MHHNTVVKLIIGLITDKSHTIIYQTEMAMILIRHVMLRNLLHTLQQC